jgi:CubicO group peptidase (beta-lactamase class C family)
MRLISKLALGSAGVVLTVVAGLAIWLSVAPPDILRIADGYAAKIVCSNTFIAGRDPQAVLEDDVQAPGNRALRLIRLSVDRDEGMVGARMLGLFAPNYAVYRGPLGCATTPDGNLKTAARLSMPRMPIGFGPDAEWPDGDRPAADSSSVLAQLIRDPTLAGPGMRAIVVIKDGRLVAENYGKGFAAKTPLLGWSMTKTVNAAIIGRLMLTGRISFDDRDLLPEWHGDGRAKIRLSDLLAMESGLAFNEAYGAVTDVTRMLYLKPDMAAMAAGAAEAFPPGEHFAYSTGTAILLSRIWMSRFADQDAALAYPQDALFRPLGMSSAVLETDAHGTFVGGSYLYATGRDWARFGEFLLRDGVWHGQRLLPEGFVGAMRTPTRNSGGMFTQVQAWLSGPGGPSRQFGLPDDTFWMLGHDGQSVAIVPSENLVVARLGLTPGQLQYRPQILLKKILEAVTPLKT